MMIRAAIVLRMDGDLSSSGAFFSTARSRMELNNSPETLRNPVSDHVTAKSLMLVSAASAWSYLAIAGSTVSAALMLATFASTISTM